MSPYDPAHPQWDRFQGAALLVGVASLTLCVLGAVLSGWTEFFRAYLLAYTYWLGLALGCLVIVMLQHLTGGAWGLVLRRLLESATRTLPLLALLFIPLVFGVYDLYQWARPEEVAHSTLLQHKQPYLNVPFFLMRAVIYFVAWLSLAYFLNKWSREQDETGDPRLAGRFRLLSSVGLVAYGLTITFASIDWVMSLEPMWYSTIYGALFGTGQVLSAFAFAIAVVILLAARPELARLLSPENWRDLGNLLLAFVMLWAYLSFSQFLVIWSGNLPEEIPWYVRRLQGGWQVIGMLLIVFHFSLPFVLLLAREVKQHRQALMIVAGLILVMRLVDFFWLIVPAFDRPGLAVHWMDVTAVVGLGGVWLAMFLAQLKRRPLLPLRDPYLPEVVPHG